ncbi:MAG: hypothetical protein EZS28_020986 [Streblomastix strix]|uniref:SH3 domain-containing protein n=1 Tax=Streblomastix strix TaxID=222440 RepID=A0A5J4VLL4_9EUKA|nr:MAG: hypothetical protein EZS28_020986 [Streblomastix strix]
MLFEQNIFLSLSTTEQYFKAIADYRGVKGDTNYIAVMKGDGVLLIKKDKEWLTVEKDGDIGKVPKVFGLYYPSKSNGVSKSAQFIVTHGFELI